jgi:NSS family neurotransmitter:Na+ symporter
MEQWSSRTGFLLAAIGAAVGLGNIWRFSAVVGQNGGGAYLIPYLLAAFVFALPLLILELAVGRSLKADVVEAFRSVKPQYEVIGWIVSGSVVLILSYYLVLTGWVFSFVTAAIAGLDLRFAGFSATLWPVPGFVVATVLTGWIVGSGVRSGIERMANVVMPVIFVVLLLLAGYATTLSGFSTGTAFLFTPDFSVLADPFIWSAAFGQVFFSLSVGQGIMLTYGSYLGEDIPIGRSALAITVADITVAILAGVVIFPIVFTVGLEPSLGTQLAFSTLPEAFDAMPFGRVVAVAFFGLLFFAALTSSVSLLEVGVAATIRKTRWSRNRTTWILSTGIFLLGIPSALSYTALDWQLAGVPILDWMDETVGTLALPLTALLIAIVFTWMQDRETVVEQLGHAWLLPILRYLIPAVLLVVTVLRLLTAFDFPGWHLLPDFQAVGTSSQVAVMLAILAVLWVIGRRLRRYHQHTRARRNR